MIKINDEYLVKILDEDYLGNGITRIDNLVVIVPYCFKNEQILIQITKIDKHYAIGKIIGIKNKSKARINISCPSYNSCGGCNYLHMELNNEELLKIKYLEELFIVKLNHLNNDNYLRNKVIFHVKNNQIGFYENKTNNIVDASKCLLLNQQTLKVLEYFKTKNLNNIKEILVRECFYSKDLLIKITGKFNDIDELVKELQPNSIYLNNQNIYGSKYIMENINNLKFIITPNSFFQVNSVNMINLYNLVKEYTGSGENLLDLYCGTGTIGIYLKDNFKNILGVDNIKDNITNALINKDLNHVNNINFKLGDASIIKSGTYDVIVVDPPRAGLSFKVITNLQNINSSKIIYVSCNPKTLKKDIELLNNYELIKLNAVNMFPRTKHIECVALLQRKNIEKN